MSYSTLGSSNLQITGSSTDFKVKKFVGNLIVLDSGVLHTDFTPIKIMIDEFEVELLFLQEEKDSTQRIETQVKQQPGLKLTLKLINFNNVLGSGLLVPTEIAVYKGKKIYITFLVNTIENNRQFTYSILTD